MTLTAGSTVDRYVLVEPLGEGGQGAVWKARDPLANDELCALKLVPTAGARPGDLERARREARALAALDHPSLVKCHGLFEDLKLGVLGIAMELVDGKSLRALLEDPRLGRKEREQVLEHLARALSHLHASGIVHRDVKMENVLVRESFWQAPESPEGVKLVDLGIASVRGADAQLTALGTIVGTMAYLAPEQLDPATFGDDSPSPALDVFAFGVLGYLLLAGRHPTGLKSGAKLADFTRAYRAGLEQGAGWPESRPEGKFGEVLARALGLRPRERPRDGGALLELLGSRPDVVLKVSSAGREGATAVATPRAMLDETLAVPSERAATQAIGPKAEPTRAKPDRFGWVVVGTLVLAAGFTTLAVRELAGPESPSKTPPLRSAASTPASPKPTPASNADAGADDADADTDAEPDALAAVDPCEAGCASGRGCGDAGCDAPLDPTVGFRLRLGGVSGDADGHALYGTYRTAEVCVAVAGGSANPTCTPLGDVEDGGVPSKSLYVENSDLSGHGLTVTIRNVVPGAGSADLGKAPQRRFDELTGNALCHGLIVDGFEDHPEWRVVFYLDEDTDAAPERCPPAASATSPTAP